MKNYSLAIISVLLLLLSNCSLVDKEETTPSVAEGYLNLEEISINLNNKTVVLPPEMINITYKSKKENGQFSSEFTKEGYDLSEIPFSPGSYKVIIQRSDNKTPLPGVPLTILLEKEFEIEDQETLTLNINEEITIDDKLMSVSITDNLFSKFENLKVTFKSKSGEYIIDKENNQVDNTFFVEEEAYVVECQADINGKTKYLTKVILADVDSLFRDSIVIDDVLGGSSPFSDSNTTLSLLTYFRLVSGFESDKNGQVYFSANKKEGAQHVSEIEIYRFHIPYNRLSSSLSVAPKDFTNYDSLSTLIIEDSDFSMLPENLTQLEYLRLFNSNFNTLPKNVTNLKSAIIVWNSFDSNDRDDIQDFLTSNKNLEFCQINENSLKSYPDLSLCTKLKHIVLNGIDHNNSQVLPEWVSKLSNLESLTYRKGVDTSIPESIKNLQKLQQLTFENCKLTNIPEWIEELPQLQEINFTSNQIDGEIPTKLFNCDQLKKIYLTRNALTGNISPDFSKLKNLTHLYLNENNLTGDIPSDISQLNNLEYLHLQFNDLNTDNIPQEILNMNLIEFKY
ncbi:leucine-rich repeat domain-containing protein [Flammeovirga aprica]|uniref:Uncharacterized protein n=1 Tax=Flammeovirga aprica JL-4 TaxID=694437 RepID=A0A7X9XB33_9BACT|nr:hypothetical protein [Flammeovirga aprica]NME70317.1 hypothetical protein [Flammeovirga aprica JL-4]